MQLCLIGVATPAGSIHGSPQALILLLKTMKSTEQMQRVSLSGLLLQCSACCTGATDCMIPCCSLCSSVFLGRDGFQPRSGNGASMALWSSAAPGLECTLRLAMVRSAAAMRRVNSSCSSCSSASVAEGCLPAED